jgi:hypothetical protein
MSQVNGCPIRRVDTLSSNQFHPGDIVLIGSQMAMSTLDISVDNFLA